jgi:hypothetical protein
VDRGRFGLERGCRATPVAQWVQYVTFALPRFWTGP